MVNNKYITSMIKAIQKHFNNINYDVKTDSSTNNFQPVFIVGAPRSGSTLLYQFLIASFNLSYISNAMALFPKYMLPILKIQQIFKLQRIDRINESDYGFVSGLFSPNEAGEIHRQLFESYSLKHQKNVADLLMKFMEISKAPIIFKNLININRLENIYRIFPKARFIFIKRDISYNAQSILEARVKLKENINYWVGTKPAGFEKVKKESPYYQVIWQIKKIEEIFNKFILMNEVNSLLIKYEDFCENVNTYYSNFSDFLNLDYKEIDTSNIKHSNDIRIKKEEWQLLEFSNKLYNSKEL
jgi:hypothetical protein